jgi:multicomponent Na+:H+ antiporter subunit D
MSTEITPALALAVPGLGALLIGLAGRWPNLRETVTMVTALATFAIVASLIPEVLDGARPAVNLVEDVPGIRLALQVEPLGMIYALIASFLWIFNSIYSFGYMRANREHKQTRYYICFAVAIASALGIAFSANLFTLFLFYEALTFSTFPLVAHKETPEAIRSGRIYLGILVFTSTCLMLLAIVWTYAVTGTVDFRDGGILAGKVTPAVGAVLFVLFILGTGKAAVMPFHFWLPAAMVAPTPVSALLHAVAVVKAGVFIALKIAVFTVGVDFISRESLGDVLCWMAGGTVIVASLVALTKDNLKARLAYSTVSQLSYIVLAAVMGSRLGIVGGSMHIAMHAFGKITLFFCAGAIYTAHHLTEISDMRGVGRAMPVTTACFLVGSLSIIGLPPFGGAWSKWFLGLGALEADRIALLVVFLVSSLLNVAYLLPIAIRGFVQAPTHEALRRGVKEAPLACVIPIVVTAAGCLVLFLFPQLVYQFSSQILR